MSEAPAIEMRGITRRFPRCIANDRITLRVEKGEVHALVGENGAGKSTLMKMLYGMDRPDDGTMVVHGREVRFRSPSDAIAVGIGMVHQHFMLVGPFTVAENVILGQEQTHGGFLDRRAAEARVGELAKQYNMAVNPAAITETLSVGEQQRVEILKVLYRQAEIIILDEPTAVLTPQEVDDFLETVRQLRASGKTIIVITHKLREVMEISDNLTILRGGRNVTSLQTAKTNPAEIARFMVGRDVVIHTLAQEIEKLETGQNPADAPSHAAADHPHTESGATPALRVTELTIHRKGARDPLSNISFEIAPGEVLGIAGVEGNGQTELVEVLTGLRHVGSGKIELDGRDVTTFAPRNRFAAGLACVPEDRHRQGMILNFSLMENLRLGRHRERDASQPITRRSARALLDEYDVRPPNPRAIGSHLSGGNQQKVIVAREFTRDASVLIASQPTRGIDLGAIEFIHQKILQMREAGKAILLVSAELSEILALSDRIAVMYGGKIVFTAPNHGLTEHQLGIWMAGGHAAA